MCIVRRGRTVCAAVFWFPLSWAGDFSWASIGIIQFKTLRNILEFIQIDLMGSIFSGGAYLANFHRSLSNDTKIVAILTTSIAVFIGCLFLFVWRKSVSKNSSKVARATPVAKPAALKLEDLEVDIGKKKVTVFFGTQTGTAEGFAKALVEEAKSRYDKAVFKIVDLDDYAAADDEYEEKLKKETLAFFYAGNASTQMTFLFLLMQLW